MRVVVRVQDENDHAPQFLESVYKIQLPEHDRTPERRGAIRREQIYRVIASDRDAGPNGDVSYSIEEGDEQGRFFIDPRTGQVSSGEDFIAGQYDILTVSPLNVSL